MARSPRNAKVVMRTREAILDGAMVAFAQQGYHAVTVKDIATAAGYTAPSLYNYFGSKEEIFAALLERLFRVFIGIYDEPVPSGLSFAQRLELMIRRHLDEHLRQSDAFVLFMKAQLAAMPSEELARWKHQAFEAYIDRLTRWIEESASGEELALYGARTLAFQLWGTMFADFARMLLGEDLEADPAAHTQRIVSLFLHGIRGGST